MTRRIVLDTERDTISVEGTTYSLGILASGFLTPPGVWVRFERGVAGEVVVTQSTPEAIALGLRG